VAEQTVPAFEILVGVRADDLESPPVVEEFGGKLPVRIVAAEGVGVIGSMNSCLRGTQGDFVALLDDDVEIPADWLENALRHFAADANVAGVGGRDLLQDHPEMRLREPLTKKVGIYTWYGRGFGNHHRGTGPARSVHVLKGCNCIYRGDVLRQIGLDERLRGAGAQVGWELSLAFDVRRGGGKLVYDPGIRVIHWVAPRQDSDSVHRGAYDRGGLRDIAFNDHLIVQSKALPVFRITHPMWNLIWGSRWVPGVVRATYLWAKGDRLAWERFQIGWEALVEAGKSTPISLQN